MTILVHKTLCRLYSAFMRMRNGRCCVDNQLINLVQYIKPIVLQGQSSCQRHCIQRQPFSSNSVQHGSKRQDSRVLCAPRRVATGHVKRSVLCKAMNVGSVVDHLKEQAQKQKTAAVLGAFGILASGLALAGIQSASSSSAASPSAAARTIWGGT